jgi:Fe-S cluster assembly ATP-binding protein
MYEKNRGSIMIISHQERILNIADKIVLLKGGEIVRVGTKDEIMPELIGISSAGCIMTETSAKNGAAEKKN